MRTLLEPFEREEPPRRTTDHRTESLLLFGEIDISRQAEISRLFACLDESSDIVIKMDQVSFIDSSFVNELAQLRRRLPHQPIRLVGVRSQVARILRIVGFYKIFDVIESDKRAQRELRTGIGQPGPAEPQL